MKLLKFRYGFLAWAALIAGLALAATAGLASGSPHAGQLPTFEPVGTVIIPTIDFGSLLPTPEPLQFITPPALPTQQYFEVPSELIATPPWKAASPTPTSAPAPQAQPDYLRDFLLACLLLLAIGVFFGLVYWLATGLPKMIRRAQAQRRYRNVTPAPQREPPAQRTPSPPPPLRPEPAPSVPPEPPAAMPLAEGLHEGIRQIRQGQLDGGIDTLRRVLQSQPQNADAWLWLGLACIAKKDWRTAERCLRQAEKLGQPQAAAALEGLAKLRPPGSGAANAG